MKYDYPAGWPLYRDFVEEVKSKNRFFPNEKFLRLFDKIIENEYNRTVIPEGTDLYRARRNELNREFEYVSELGANKKNPSHNRASPIGIPYMYLAENPHTAIAEVRANVHDAVTVATFKTKRDLNFLVLDYGSVYGGTIDGEFSGLEIVSFICYLSFAFAAPVQKQAELEYLPTQYFSEYCKSRGIAGIKYISSARGFHGEGGSGNHFNYVLFDDTNVSFVEAYRYSVRDIQYTIDRECSITLKDEGEK